MLKRLAKLVFWRSLFRSRETAERCNVRQAARLSGQSLAQSGQARSFRSCACRRNRDSASMSEQIGRWDELEQALLALGDGVMVLEEFDGFVAGLLVCPELIPGREWIAAAF